MFNEKTQAKAIIIVFGIFSNICFIAGFYNKYHFVLATCAGIIAFSGVSELMKSKKEKR